MTERKPDPLRGLFLAGMMLGGAIGAAIGLLFAPRTGADSRQDFAEWAEMLRARASDQPDEEEEQTGDKRAPTGGGAP
jgi:gas vesicle protein